MTISEAYKILEVSENSSEEEIKAAYKKLAKKYHPDFYQNNPLASLAEEKLKEINEAYEVLEKYSKEEKSKPITEFFVKIDSYGRKIYFYKKTGQKINGTIIDTGTHITAIAEVNDGYLNGIYKEFDINGVEINKANYKDGILNGDTYSFNRDGKSFYKITYEEGIIIKIQDYLITESQGDFLYSESFFEYGKKSRPQRTYNVETNQFEEIEKINFSKISSKEDLEIRYYLGQRFGDSKFFYDTGIEIARYKEGIIRGLATYYDKNGNIKKYYYEGGIKQEKKSVIEYLSNITYNDIKNLSYIKNGKTHLIDLKENDFIFYSCYKDVLYYSRLKLINEMLKISKENMLEERIKYCLNIFEKNFLNYNNMISTDEYIKNSRKKKILLTFDNFKEKDYNITFSNITEMIEVIADVIEKLFEKLFFEEEHYRNSKIPDILGTEYWIEVFKEAYENNKVTDNLIEIFNVILKKDNKAISLLNICIGLKYKMNNFVLESLNALKNKKWHEDYYEEFFKEIFDLKSIDEINDFILCLDYLLNNQKISIDVKEKNIFDLKNLYKKLKKFIVEARENTLLVSYKKEIESFNEKLQKFNFKILDLERELNDKKKQEMNLKIEKCGKLLSELKMKYLETDIDRDKTEFEEIENNIKFLSDIKSNELTDEQLEKLSKLKEINDLAIHKITVYEKELTEMSKDREKIQNDKTFTPITCLIGAIIGVYFIFKNFNGLITMIAIPVIFTIASKIISSVKQETDKKTKELNLKQKNINSIINVAQRINKILDSFL